jgi:N-formylglutamate amidohydrolase
MEKRTYEDRKEYFRKYWKKYRAKVRKQIKEYKINKGCKVCGYNSCSSALIFHHKNKDKEFQIARGQGCRSFNRILKEIEKCDVLCSNCHLELHYPN